MVTVDLYWGFSRHTCPRVCHVTTIFLYSIQDFSRIVHSTLTALCYIALLRPTCWHPGAVSSITWHNPQCSCCPCLMYDMPLSLLDQHVHGSVARMLITFFISYCLRPDTLMTRHKYELTKGEEYLHFKILDKTTEEALALLGHRGTETTPSKRISKPISNWERRFFGAHYLMRKLTGFIRAVEVFEERWKPAEPPTTFRQGNMKNVIMRTTKKNYRGHNVL